MKYVKNIKLIIMALATVLLSACGSSNASYVESGGSQSLSSTRKINIADWNNAAATLVNDMLSSGAIDNTGLPYPVKMQVSNVINNTSNVIDVSMITNQISIALNNTGKVSTVSTDALTSELAQYEAMKQGKKVGLPKFTLTGKISEDRETVGRTKEVTYIFSMELNYIGKAIWMGQKQISKQSTRPMIGF